VILLVRRATYHGRYVGRTIPLMILERPCFLGVWAPSHSLAPCCQPCRLAWPAPGDCVAAPQPSSLRQRHAHQPRALQRRRSSALHLCPAGWCWELTRTSTARSWRCAGPPAQPQPTCSTRPRRRSVLRASWARAPRAQLTPRPGAGRSRRQGPAAAAARPGGDVGAADCAGAAPGHAGSPGAAPRPAGRGRERRLPVRLWPGPLVGRAGCAPRHRPHNGAGSLEALLPPGGAPPSQPPAPKPHSPRARRARR